MADARKIVIEFLGNDRSLSSTARSATSSTSRLGDSLKKVGKVAAFALAAGVVVAGKALFDMTKMAIEDQKSQALLANTLKRTTGATDDQVAKVEDWISAQGKALGVADDELRPALQRLAEATGDVGEAQKLASIAMDVSAGTGKSLKTVSEALMKAQNGQISGLSRLGIETTNARGETLTFEQATAKMADTFEGAAATSADTLEGKMGRLKLMFDETREEIGAKLIPVITDMADWFLEKALPAIKDLGGELKDRFGPILQRVGEWISGTLIPAIQRFAEDALPAAKKMLGSVKDALSDAQPFFRLLGDIIVDVLIPMLGKLAKTVLPVLGDALKILGKALGKVGEIGRWMWNNVLQPVFKLFIENISRVLTFFGKMLQVIGKVPKMGWVGDLGDKLVRTGEDADGLANSIVKIPDKHNTNITMNASQANAVLAQIEGRLNNLADHLQGMFGGSSGKATTPGAPRTSTSSGGVMPRMAARTGSMAMGGGEPIQVNLYLDGKQILQSLVRQKRTLGRDLGLA